MKRLASLLLTAAVAALAAGCDSYQRTDVTAVVSSIQGTSFSSTDAVTPTSVRITEGNIVKAHVVIYDDDDEPMPLTMRSTRPDIIEVAAVQSRDDYTFTGLQVGEATIELISDGDVVNVLNATVVAQPAP
ncbi:MAG: hypothetical protein KIT84_11655 [Labilithrix sp.]|nr:hypothetical protein [Labilithrix sp.]MCW5811665.1 hypothetical protein [Labilithrix sp.]